MRNITAPQLGFPRSALGLVGNEAIVGGDGRSSSGESGSGGSSSGGSNSEKSSGGGDAGSSATNGNSRSDNSSGKNFTTDRQSQGGSLGSTSHQLRPTPILSSATTAAAAASTSSPYAIITPSIASDPTPGFSSAQPTIHPQRQLTKKRGSGTANKNMQRVNSRARSMKIAKRRGGCRNKVWLALENHHSSPWAEKVYLTRLVIYLAAAVSMMVSTWPEYNAYGNDQRHCRRLVVNYCNQVSSTASTKKQEWMDTNLACFPNSTSGYLGCLDEATCQFPSMQYNMTCENNALFQGCDVHPQACSTR